MTKQVYKDLVAFTNYKFNNNSYIVIKNGKCIIIDPSYNDHEIIEYLTNKKIKPLAIILTHGHHDHVGNSINIVNRYKINVYIYKEEKQVVEQYNLQAWLDGKTTTKYPKFTYFENDTLSFNQLKVKILKTPGHTIGGVCYIVSNYLFTGDLLFADSIGRTDFPTGNVTQLINSINSLKSLPHSLMVFPGHNAYNITFSDILKSNKVINF